MVLHILGHNRQSARASRSEAAAFFIKEGIQARNDLFQKVMPTVDKIRELKEQAKKSLEEEEPQ
jgi:hypothetical protein